MNRLRIAHLALTALALACACGPKTMRARVSDGERAADRTTFSLLEAERAMERGELARAEGLLSEAKQSLAHPDLETNPEQSLLQSRLVELDAKATEARARATDSALSAKLDARREVIDASMQRYRALKAEVAARPHDRRVQAQLRAAARQAREDIDWEADLTRQDPEFSDSMAELAGELNGGAPALDIVVERATVSVPRPDVPEVETPVSLEPAEAPTVARVAQGAEVEQPASAAKAPARTAPVIAPARPRSPPSRYSEAVNLITPLTKRAAQVKRRQVAALMVPLPKRAGPTKRREQATLITPLKRKQASPTANKQPGKRAASKVIPRTK